MYHAVDAGLIRVSASPLAAYPPVWPDVDCDADTDVECWREWINDLWEEEPTATAISIASPHLADAVRKVLDGHVRKPRTIRRTVLSLMRYLLRMQHRATPFGLFAGPAPVHFAPTPRVRWGTGQRAFARADATWLHEITTALEQSPDVLRHLPVVADSTCTARGGRITVMHQPGVDGPTDTTLRRTPAVEAVLNLAPSPITIEDIVAKLRADHPRSSPQAIEDMVHGLVAHRVLRTSLTAPMTCDDALGHLLEQLEASAVAASPDASETAKELLQIHQTLTRHNTASPDRQSALRAQANTQMNALTPGTDHTLMVSLRPDCDVTLPTAVAREAEQALKTIARITPYPNGSPAWQDYRTRFLERYSMGAVVPLRDLTDPDTGLGLPAGYRGTVLNRPVLATTRRDEHLLAIAQKAALTGHREVVLSEDDVEALSLGAPAQVPAHVELCFTVLSDTLKDLERGRFTLQTAGLSLAAGTTTGRFLPMLEQADRDRMTAAYAALPTLTDGAARVQISSPPLRTATRNVGRAPTVLAHVLSIGEYHPHSSLDLDDLGVVADSQRLALVTLSTGHPLEPQVMNAVELSTATHPLVRFLCEVHRSHTAILIPFAWGTAAKLPFLPAIRTGRTVLSAACWRLTSRDVGTVDKWTARFNDWRSRYRLPAAVYVGNDDQRLRLDLDTPAHLALLRTELDRHQTVVLHEAPDTSALGWLGRAHEVTVSFASTQPPAPAPARQPGAATGRDAGRLPGASAWAYLKLYCNADRATELLTTHLPNLLADESTGVTAWWFTRYHDPEHHLRIRLKLPNPGGFGDLASQVAAWAARMRCEGLIQRVQWDTDTPETGRYGTGEALQAAERYFAADSAAAVAQLALTVPGPLRPAVTAASFVDIASAFLGAPSPGHHWLTANFRKSEGDPAPRDVLAAARRLAAPDPRRPSLIALPGGETVTAAWTHRAATLTDYRQALEARGIDPATVLASLLHMHHNRIAGITPDAEATCRRLARSAALSWTTRTEGAAR